MAARKEIVARILGLFRGPWLQPTMEGVLEMDVIMKDSEAKVQQSMLVLDAG